MYRGAIAIESSTVTPARVSALAARVTAVGAEFLDAPVVGSRPAAESGTLAYVVGGAVDIVERARPVLSAMGNAIHHVGPTPAGAIVKLMVNTLFGVQVAVLAELLELGRRARIDVTRTMEVMGALPVMSPAGKGALASMLVERFEPMFPIHLVAKDFDYAVALGEETKSALPVTRRVAEVFADAVDRGFTGGIYKTGAAMLRTYMVKTGYMVIADKLELIAGYQGADADTYAKTWTTALLGANWFINKHDLKLQTTFQHGKDVKGKPGVNQDDLFAQVQYVF